MIDVDLNNARIPLSWNELFDREAPTDVEIGSGKGRFLNLMATEFPERNFLAVERAAKYHSLCCERAAKRGLRNVRLLHTTAEDLLFRLLAPASVHRIFVLFPDPWPKKRHHKRRLISADTLAAMARVLVPRGELLIKSDHEDYAAVIAELLTTAHSHFQQIDASDAFAGLPLSGFEHKYNVQGREIHAFALRSMLNPAVSRCTPHRSTG